MSRMELRIDGEKPAVLSSAGDKSYVANFRLMKDVKDEGAIEVKRDCFIYDGILYVRIAITNYFVHDSRFGLSVAFGADFQDMFLVRKYRGGEVGFMEEPVIGDGEIMLGYVGADRERRQARITWDAQGGAVHRDGTVSFPIP